MQEVAGGGRRQQQPASGSGKQGSPFSTSSSGNHDHSGTIIRNYTPFPLHGEARCKPWLLLLGRTRRVTRSGIRDARV